MDKKCYCRYLRHGKGESCVKESVMVRWRSRSGKCTCCISGQDGLILLKKAYGIIFIDSVRSTFVIYFSNNIFLENRKYELSTPIKFKSIIILEGIFEAS